MTALHAEAAPSPHDAVLNAVLSGDDASATPDAALDEPTLPPTQAPEEIGQAATQLPGTAATGSVACPNCGGANPSEFAFCGNCGGRLGLGEDAAEPAPIAAAPAPTPLGRLLLIRPDGTPDGEHELLGPETIIGRGSGPLFESDGYLSPRHARIFVEKDEIQIEDIGSLNGVFYRLTEQEQLASGDVFRIGQELLRFDAIGEPQPAEDGTEILGSPNPGYWGRLSLIVSQDIDGSAFPLMGDEMVLGREQGDILFSDDGYVSSAHAKITIDEQSRVYVADLGSSNGTFIRLNEARPLVPGAFVLIGQQLFRFEEAA